MSNPVVFNILAELDGAIEALPPEPEAIIGFLRTQMDAAFVSVQADDWDAYRATLARMAAGCVGCIALLDVTANGNALDRDAVPALFKRPHNG